MGRHSTLSLLGLRDGSSFSRYEFGEDGSSCSVGTHVFFLYTLFLLSLSLSLSLSSGVCESGNHLKVKYKCNWFSCVKLSILQSTEIHFQFDRIFMRTQTSSRV